MIFCIFKANAEKEQRQKNSSPGEIVTDLPGKGDDSLVPMNAGSWMGICRLSDTQPVKMDC